MTEANRSTSPVDTAFAIFKTQLERGGLFFRESADLSEADTRAKFIDPILKDVLGWGELDIRREEPVASGYVDYVIGADYPHFHIEAKRIRPRFELQVSSRSRLLKLSGPHLLGNRDLRPFLEQAARYAFDLGSEFTLLTNGEQVILFRTRLPGRRWSEGLALVWHDHADIQSDFAHFYAVISRDAVVAGSLQQEFETAEGVTTPLYSPLTLIKHPDAELVRNRLWDRISRAVGPLLTDAPGDADLQEEIIRYCYVRTRLSDQADESINRLLQDTTASFLSKAGAVDLQPGMQGRTAFDYHIEKDVKGGKASTYILTGGVGSGKTTFLRRFARVVAAAFVREWCIWLHVDYLAMGTVTEGTLEEDLTRYTYSTLRGLLRAEYPDLLPTSGAAMRALFSEEIKEAELTLLYGVAPDSSEWNGKVNEIVYRAQTDDPRFVQAMLKSASRRSRRVVMVLDNTDQLGERFQEAVFLLSQRLARECTALTIVALREEKFFAAYRRGIFDAYGDRRFHIGSPNLEGVIRKRLDYAINRYLRQRKAEGADSTTDTDREVQAVLHMFIRSTTKGNYNIVRLLSCVSNGDMRYALGMFREFVGSGNTDVEKIFRIVRQSGGYTVPFHEFAKSAILGSRRYYRSSVSHIVNLFLKAPVRGASHWTACRLLARLTAAESAPSRHGVGFVDTSQLLSEYRSSFGNAQDMLVRGEELLRRGLIESEPPRVAALEESDALRIAASGAYYWRYLARAFAYLDLALVDTGIADRALAQRLADLSHQTSMTVRFERVRAFLDHIALQEASELELVGRADGPYREALAPSIRQQVESEIAVIKAKTGVGDSEDSSLT